MAIIISNENSIEIDGTIMPLNSRDVTRLNDGVRISKSGANSHIDIPLEDTSIDGVDVESVDDLMDFFRSKGFSLGGGDGSNGVASVSGNIVDNGDPENPKINLSQDVLDHHLKTDNPHNVTKEQLGLDKVDNTSDLEKPLSVQVISALDGKADVVDGKVPEQYLPSYIDSVQEYEGESSFPSEGLNNVVYLDTTTNKPFRWGGSSYVEIGSGLALGETISTAYRGDRGKIAYDHTLDLDNPHEVTASQIGAVTKDYVDNLVGKVWMPDYANIETQNRITTSGGTWTVPAGRMGFVKLFGRTYSSGILDMNIFIINDVVVERIWVESPAGSGDARSGSRTGIYAVKPGDVVKVNSFLETGCHFIPGIWV